MTELCPIPPVGYLRDFCTDPYQLALAQHAKVYGDYRHFFQRHGENKANYVILDNGQHEDVQTDPVDLVTLGLSINAREIALPDLKYNWPGTVQSTSDALSRIAEDDWCRGQLAKTRMTWMLIPQGRNLHELMQCYKELAVLYKLACLKWPEIYGAGPTWALPSKYCNEILDTEELREYFERCLLMATVNDGSAIHLLGWDRIGQVPWLVRRYKTIRSVDTAKPFVLAIAGWEPRQGNAYIERYPGRPSNYFTATMTTSDLQRATGQLELFRSAVGHTGHPTMMIR